MRSTIFALALVSTPAVVHAEPLNVVASFSILADMVEQVGGDSVSVTSLVGPGEDAHVYEPTPSDVVRVAGANLVVINGLGFEGFVERLIEASETEAPVIAATDGIQVLETTDDDPHHDHGGAEDGHGHDDHAHDAHAHDEDDHSHDHAHDHGHEAEDDHAHDDHAHDDHAHDDHDHGPIDPHAWQSFDAAKTYVHNIEHALCDVRPGDCASFESNAAAYIAAIENVEAEWQQTFAEIPAEQRVVITNHDAFGYLARDFDMTILAAQGLSTNAEASAADVAVLIDQIRETGATALFAENISDPRLLEQIADETGLAVSGTLYSGALAASGEESTYLGMMEANLRAISEALLATN